MKKTIYLIPHNHFDPTWRRCFDRPAVYNGVTVRSYAEVEAHCINAWLALADRGYTFSEGQTAVWRKYLERHPDRKAELQQRARTGSLDVLLAGETVQDSVMPTAEGLVRNFLVALPFYADFVGRDHPALRIASAEDAFGNSPNYPQVLRGVGAEVVVWTSYRPCPEHIWVGIDGTKLATLDRHPSSFSGGFAKHAPCPACAGRGCAECGDTGLLFVDGFDMEGLRRGIEAGLEAHKDSDWIAVRFLTEEIRPDARVADFVASWNREHADSELRFANPLDVYRRHKPTLDAALRERDDQPSADLNPAMPGCLVSRILCKQRVRAISYHLLAAEAALANRQWADNAPAAPPADFADAWRLVTFNHFHDAITGTHIDSAYIELMDMLNSAESLAAHHLPLPARRVRTGRLQPVADETTTRKLGALDVSFDRRGILSIQRDGRDLFGEFPPPWNNRRRRARISELSLEPDFGDAWGKRIGVPAPGQIDYAVVLLGDYHTSVEASDQAIRWRGKYSGGDPMVRRLEWTITAAASRDGTMLEFHTDVRWDTHSRRLRVLVPVRSADPTALYEVPFGFIARTFDAAKLDFSVWSSDTREFPTLHWVYKSVDSGGGVALLNRGLPCNRWAPGMLDLSLVRSPEFCFCGVEPSSYEFWDIDGLRDTGRHSFEYAIYPCYDGQTPADLTRTGYAYNLAAPFKVPFRVEGNVIVTAWKPAESGAGWVLRLQEAAGAPTTVRLTFKDERSVTRTNLLEEPEAAAARGSRFEMPLHRHGIATLLIR